MRVSPIQDSFAAGQISGRSLGRVSSDAYQQGLLLARNMIPLPQGSIRSRCGLRFSDTIHPDNSRSVLFPFYKASGTDLVVEVGDGKVVVRGTTGIEQESLSENLLSDPTFQNSTVSSGGGIPGDSEPWTFSYGPWSRTRDVLNATALPPSIALFESFSPYPIRLAAASGPTNRWPYYSGVGQPGEWALTRARLSRGSSFITQNNNLHSCLRELVSTPEPAKVHSWIGRVSLPTPISYDNPVPPVNFYATVIITSDEAGTTVIHRQEHNFTTWDEEYTFNFTFTPAVSEFWVTIGCFFSDLTGDYDVTRVRWFPQFCGYAITGASNAAVEFTSPYQSSQLDAIQFAFDAAERELWLFHPDVESRRLKYTGGLWTFEALTAIPGYTGPSGTGPTFNGTLGWPRTGCFHEGRLLLAGTATYPSTVWGSRVFNYIDFDESAPTAKDDPVLYPITASGSIQWILSSGVVYVGMDTEEGILYGPAEGTLAFDDFKYEDQSSWGCGPVQAVKVGRKVLYTTNSRNRVRTFEPLGDTRESYDGLEVSFYSSDILLPQVKAMRFSTNPETQLIVLLNNGTIACCTYDYNSKIPGWDIMDTEGVIESIAITRQRTSDYLWVVVNRNGIRYIEYMTWCQMSVGASLDSFFQGEVSGSGIVTSPKLSHLIGKLVTPVVKVSLPEDASDFPQPLRFSVHPPVLVTDSAGDGSVQLEEWAAGSIAYIGIPYDVRLRMLPIEGVSSAGTSLVSKQRFSEIFVRLVRSSIPLINGTAPEERRGEDIMDTAPEFVTKDVSVDGGPWIEDALVNGSVEIYQDQPLFIEIAGIFGKLAVKEV